jgi:uncharacterized membrane protein
MTGTLLTSFQEPGRLSLYNLVLFVHVASAIVAFGITFVSPVLVGSARQMHPRALPAVHAFQERAASRLLSPAATLVLLAGIYLAAVGPYDFGEPFVGSGIVIILALLGLGGAYFAPRARRLSDLARRDVEASGTGDVRLSEDYERAARQAGMVEALGSALVLVAVFLMVVKPGT